VGGAQSSSDTSLSIWFILLLILIYVSVPIHGIVLVGALIQLIKGNGSAYRWVFLYLIVAISGHLVIGYSQGAFESQLIAAILILTAGGKAYKDGPLKDVLRNQAEDPVLNELQELILRDKPAASCGECAHNSDSKS